VGSIPTASTNLTAENVPRGAIRPGQSRCAILAAWIAALIAPANAVRRVHAARRVRAGGKAHAVDRAFRDHLVHLELRHP
jgi:hypothetical protein